MENKINMVRKGEKLILFLKKYGYFIVAGLIVVAITLSVLLTTTGKAIIDDDDDTQDVDHYAITFTNPLLDCSVALRYSIDELLYNPFLGWIETNEGVDLISFTSNEVLAASDGKVVDIYSNSIEGTVVVIKHNDVFTSRYGCLDSNVVLEIGDTVVKGQKIGTISASSSNENDAHLHFELLENDTKINPADYLNLEDK